MQRLLSFQTYPNLSNDDGNAHKAGSEDGHLILVGDPDSVLELINVASEQLNRLTGCECLFVTKPNQNGERRNGDTKSDECSDTDANYGSSHSGSSFPVCIGYVTGRRKDSLGCHFGMVNTCPTLMRLTFVMLLAAAIFATVVLYIVAIL